jgi:hypothetical protein
MQKYLFVTICLALFAACAPTDKNKIPNTVLSQEKMQAILYDMHLAEAIANKTQAPLDSVAGKALGMYQEIYSKHQVSEEQFKTSYDFYIEHPVLLDSVYSRVIDELSVQEAFLRK